MLCFGSIVNLNSIIIEPVKPDEFGKMDNQLEIDTHVLASVVTGVVLGNVPLADLLKIYSQLYGTDLSIEKIALTSTRMIIVEEAYRQFPDLPTKLEAEENWEAAREKAIQSYGDTVVISLGTSNSKDL